jgi:hypothetical protein
LSNLKLELSSSLFIDIELSML